MRGGGDTPRSKITKAGTKLKNYHGRGDGAGETRASRVRIGGKVVNDPEDTIETNLNAPSAEISTSEPPRRATSIKRRAKASSSSKSSKPKTSTKRTKTGGGKSGGGGASGSFAKTTTSRRPKARPTKATTRPKSREGGDSRAKAYPGEVNISEAIKPKTKTYRKAEGRKAFGGGKSGGGKSGSTRKRPKTRPMSYSEAVKVAERETLARMKKARDTD